MGKSKKGPVNADRVRDLFSRAVQAIQSGNIRTGRQLLIKTDKLAPGNPSILYNLGYVHHLMGRYTDAVSWYRKCTDQDSSNIDAWVNLATAARESGQTQIAINAYQKVLSSRGEDPDLHNDLANLLVAVGHFDEAVTHYGRALDLRPQSTLMRRNLAQVLKDQGKLEDAETEFRKVLLSDSGDAQARLSLVQLLDGQNRIKEAVEVLMAKPGGLDSVTEWLFAGNLQTKLGETEAAESSYRAVLKKDANHAVAMNNLGLVRAIQADREEAASLFRRAIDSDPSFTDPWRNLVALRKYRDSDDPDIRAMRMLSSQSHLSNSSRIHLGFALGKALDDCGRYDEAFGDYRTANDLRRQETHFDPDALIEHAGRIKTQFTQAFLAEREDWGNHSMMPVYIVGLPRTGTTLVEQILSTHPAFHGADELLLINQLIHRLETTYNDFSMRAYPECAGELSKDLVRVLSDGYLAELQSIANDPGVLRVSDKMPYNFFHLGLVRLLFPAARIIHCTRHPLDTCLSAYFNYFPKGLDFSYSLDDLAAFYKVYRDLMTHWQDSVGMDLVEVSYEALVEEPRKIVGRILQYLGLEWDDRVLYFHQSERNVQTLSAWQVRKPLHGGSKGRWKNYETQLEPLVHALAPYVNAKNPI